MTIDNIIGIVLWIVLLFGAYYIGTLLRRLVEHLQSRYKRDEKLSDSCLPKENNE
jgi:hypothetical protein